MIKKLLPVFAFLVGTASFAQTIMSENFDAATTLPAGWVQYNVDGLTPATNVNFMGTDAWVVRTKSGSDKHLCSTSWYTPAGVSNDWLASPSIAVPAAGATEIKFDVIAPDATYSDGFKVYISTTGNTVADFSAAPVLTVAAGPNTYTTQTVDVSSFAGQTIYFAIQNYSNDKFLLYFDNFLVRQPAANDVKLNSVTLNRYSATSTNNNLVMSVFNDGSNPVTSLSIDWNDGTAHPAVISGLNILPGTSANVTHTAPVTYATVLEKNITASIALVNNAVDPVDPLLNTASKKFNTVSAIVPRNVLMEEGTGTWCQWCPRGAVVMDYMTATYPKFIGVAVHNADPMTLTEYDTEADFSGFPGCNIDRTLIDMSISQSLVEGYYNAQKDIIVPATVNGVATITGNNISVNASAKFVSNYTTANYRLALIMSEDGVKGTGTGYNQVNAYAGGASGPMGGYESLPNPVPAAQMVYDHVGRALVGGYNGQAGSIPAAITDGQTVNYTFTYTVPATSQRFQMHAIVVLIDSDNGQIVNSKAIPLTSLGVDEEVASIDLNVYPNPATDAINVAFTAENDNYNVSIIDMQGRVMSTTHFANLNGAQKVTIPTSELAGGNYLISVATDKASYTTHFVVR